MLGAISSGPMDQEGAGRVPWALGAVWCGPPSLGAGEGHPAGTGDTLTAAEGGSRPQGSGYWFLVVGEGKAPRSLRLGFPARETAVMQTRLPQRSALGCQGVAAAPLRRESGSAAQGGHRALAPV